MQALCEEIVSAYQVRRGWRKKTRFLQHVQDALGKAGIESRIERQGMLRSRNLVIGDVEHAQVVVGAHYDTCMWLPLPNLILPRNVVLGFLYQLLMALPVLGVCWGLAWGTSALLGLSRIPVLLFAGFALLLLVLGPSNRHTCNDNTSGVVLLLELVLGMPKEQRDKAAFVLFDHEELGLLGSAGFCRRHRQALEHVPLLNADCVGEGEHLLVIAPRCARREAVYLGLKQELCDGEGRSVHFLPKAGTMYPSDHLSAQKGIALAFVKKKPVVGYFLGRIHTGRDRVFCRENIAFLTRVLTRTLDGLSSQKRTSDELAGEENADLHYNKEEAQQRG